MYFHLNDTVKEVFLFYKLSVDFFLMCRRYYSEDNSGFKTIIFDMLKLPIQKPSSAISFQVWLTIFIILFISLANLNNHFLSWPLNKFI